MYSSLAVGAVEDDSFAAVLQERSDFALPSDLDVDALVPGVYDSANSLAPGRILAGTIVSDSFLYLDPVQSTGTRFAGTLTFSRDILGVIATAVNLDKSDSVLGLSGVTFPVGDDVRGFELSHFQDQFTISSDRRTLSFNALTCENVDELRVITAGDWLLSVPGALTVPEPGTSLLVMSGFTGLLFLRRTKEFSL